MSDFLNSTNVIIGIIAGLFTIFGPIIGVLKRRQTVLKTIEYQPPHVQVELRERWSIFALIWRTWMGILIGIVFAVMFTGVPYFIISIFIAVITSSQTHQFVAPNFSNPIVFAICAILGVSMGITVAVGIAAPKRGISALYTAPTSNSMHVPNNPYGWTNMNSPNNPFGWTNMNSPNNPNGWTNINSPNNPNNPFHHHH